MPESLIVAFTALGAVSIVSLSALNAWRGWLELRRETLRGRPVDDVQNADIQKDDVGVRIELAAVRERLKKLEAIASGVDI